MSPTTPAEQRSPNAGGNALLYRGIKNILRCDEAEVVAGIANYVMSQHPVLRIGSRLMERTRKTPFPSVMAFLGAVTRFLEVRKGYNPEGVIWVARLGNERRAIERIINRAPDLSWTELQLGRPPDSSSLRALMKTRSKSRRIMRIARRLHRKHEFFKALRAVELIGYYARYLGIFQQGRYSVAVMSSHSNPHAIAFNLAARRAGVPVVLITHGMPVRPVARLDYDLALVHCEASKLTYADEGCHLKRVLVHGRSTDYRQISRDSLPEQVKVGIFLCKDVNEELLRDLVNQLLSDPRVGSVLIRPHPKNLWRGLGAWIDSKDDPRLSPGLGGAVAQDLATVDIVLAGNSSVLIDAVTSGRAAAFVPGLDYGAPDMHRFVASGLIYSMTETIPGKLFNFDPENIFKFYQTADWPSLLHEFANIGEDEKAVAQRFADELRQLAKTPTVGSKRLI